MDKKEEKKTKENEAREKNLAYIEELKGKKNYRGVLCNTTDTYSVIFMARHFDAVMNDLRSNMYTKYKDTEVKPFFELYNDVALITERLTEVLAKFVKYKRYKISDYIKDLKKTHTLSEEAMVLIEKIEALRPGKEEIAEAETEKSEA